MFKKSLSVVVFLILAQQSMYANQKVTEKEVIVAIEKGVKSTKQFLKKIPTYKLYKNEKSILHYAVELNKYDVVEYLVDKVDLSLKGGIYYETALQDAIFYGHLKIAELLINSGTDLDIQNIDGETALHIAAKYAHADIIKQLIAAGATTNIQDNEGDRPKDLLPEMMWENRKELIEKLETAEDSEQLIQSKKIIIESTRNGIKSTITIDKDHKNIYENRIDNKSTINNSDIGITID